MTMRMEFKAFLTTYVTVDGGSAPLVSTQFNTVQIDQLNTSVTLQGGGTPDLEGEPVDLSHTLVSADDELDLTAAPIAYRTGSTVDLTGKRLIALQLRAPTTNSDTITLKTAAADGYPLGAGIDLEPGEVLVIAQAAQVSTRATVAATRRYLTIAGTTGDELEILAGFGDS